VPSIFATAASRDLGIVNTKLQQTFNSRPGRSNPLGSKDFDTTDNEMEKFFDFLIKNRVDLSGPSSILPH
jgi:hypothetical protein